MEAEFKGYKDSQEDVRKKDVEKIEKLTQEIENLKSIVDAIQGKK
jgi:hypothetical protein